MKSYNRFKNYIFYMIKPILPRYLQLLMRRSLAVVKRKKCSNVWPIDETSCHLPDNWNGWPSRKKFAFVIQHDVDTKKGHDNCRQLMDLEEELGFRSTFNIVPERYTVSEELIYDIKNRGFGLGVHGLKHDGKLFQSYNYFIKSAARINYYLENWNARGFSAPSMISRLEWMHHLNIEYSTSTFDTDPFEPQPIPVRSIFPFNVCNYIENKCFVELPYTLPQDFTLFCILKEKSDKIWKQKIEWIAKKGGMALINTHPDYMGFSNQPLENEKYPVHLYQNFLKYILQNFKGECWFTTSEKIAQFWNKTYPFTLNSQKII